MPAITEQELIDMQADAATLSQFVNGAADLEITSRLGANLRTLAFVDNGVKAQTVRDLPFVSHSTGAYYSGGVIMHDHSLRSWGSDESEQLGDGSTGGNVTSPQVVNFPPAVTADMQVTKWIRSPLSSWVLFNNGDVYAWGENSVGELGLGTLADQATPAKVTLPAGVTRFTDIAVGSFAPSLGAAGSHTVLYLADTGAVYASGNGDNGQIGNGANLSVNSPTLVSGGHNFAKIYVVGGSDAVCYGITTAGQLYAWGYNGSGQVGDGTNNNRNTPVHIDFGANAVVTKIAATMGLFTGSGGNRGIGHTLALVAGNVWAWGSNGFGQLGGGTLTDRNAPATSTSGFVVTDIFAAGGVQGTSYFCIDNGNCGGMGRKSNGQLGVNNPAATGGNETAVINIPNANRTGRTIVQVMPIGDTGQTSLFILYDDGQVFATGYNTRGQLGVGDQAQRNALTQVLLPGQFKVKKMCVVGIGDKCAAGFLTESGQYFQTGTPQNGQLGIPGIATNTNNDVPRLLQFA